MFVAKSTKSAEVILHRVAKHGSHDQSSHNPKKGGGRVGGGGAGTATTTGGTSGTLGETHTKAIQDMEQRIGRSMKSLPSNADIDPYLKRPKADALEAQRLISQGRRSKSVGEAGSRIGRADSYLQRAMDGFENENFHDVVSELNDVRVNLRTILTAAKNGTEITYPLR